MMYAAIRCPCGHRGCTSWLVDPAANFQGVRFTEPQARAVAALLNAMEQFPEQSVVSVVIPIDGGRPAGVLVCDYDPHPPAPRNGCTCYDCRAARVAALPSFLIKLLNERADPHAFRSPIVEAAIGAYLFGRASIEEMQEQLVTSLVREGDQLRKQIMDHVLALLLSFITKDCGWQPIATAPYEVVEVCGPSGYRDHQQFLALAYRDVEHRSTDWLDVNGDRLSDCGWKPTHWRPARPLPPIDEETTT